jgi:murein DD-endopeptidase MepM/ murein hydrolase activator NlpD
MHTAAKHKCDTYTPLICQLLYRCFALKKVKYYYNTHSLRYEKLETPLRVRLLQVFGFIAAAVVFAMGITFLGWRYFPSANERRLRQENADLRYSYKVLEAQVTDMGQRMAALEKRDNEVYRNIFEAEPVPDSMRAAKLALIAELKKVGQMNQESLTNSLANSLQNINNRMAFQQASFNAIAGMIERKEDLLAAIPAIQPVSNKQLERIASGFGYRIDPVYKIPKMHAGLDFTAPSGTPIYATADGRVKDANYNTGGYGNHVIINHGFGYETLYAHMVRIKARAGQVVKRGEVIGWVGSTGKSTGPHCHYEVHKNGSPVDPIYFFYNDLTPEQYDRLLKLAATRNQSFD